MDFISIPMLHTHTLATYAHEYFLILTHSLFTLNSRTQTIFDWENIFVYIFMVSLFSHVIAFCSLILCECSPIFKYKRIHIPMSNVRTNSKRDFVYFSIFCVLVRMQERKCCINTNADKCVHIWQPKQVFSQIKGNQRILLYQ